MSYEFEAIFEGAKRTLRLEGHPLQILDGESFKEVPKVGRMTCRVLGVLLANKVRAPEVFVGREVFNKEVWEGKPPSPGALDYHLSQLNKRLLRLDDSELIKNLPREGWRFEGEVRKVQESLPEEAPRDDLRDALRKVFEHLSQLQRTVETVVRRPVSLSPREANTAYYLGYIATTLPTINDDSHVRQIEFIRRFCDDLSLHFSDEERGALQAAARPSDAEKISEIVLSRAQHDLPQQLWCFFSLGNTVPWLLDQVERATCTKEALEKLGVFLMDDSFNLDPRYALVVDALIKDLAPYREALPDTARLTLKRRIHKTRSQVPPIHIQGRNAYRPVLSTDWIWLADGAALRLFGGRYAVLALQAGTWDVIVVGPEGKEESMTRVTHNAAAWNCAAHPRATVQAPCFEIKLVFDATDGGKPVTEARVVAVKK